MTEEEAIEILKDERDYAQLPWYVNQALEMAIKALEKQIPRKPLNPCGRYYGKAKCGNCPICGAGTNSVTYTYCRKCGQALDWGEEE